MNKSIRFFIQTDLMEWNPQARLPSEVFCLSIDPHPTTQRSNSSWSSPWLEPCKHADIGQRCTCYWSFSFSSCRTFARWAGTAATGECPPRALTVRLTRTQRPSGGGTDDGWRAQRGEMRVLSGSYRAECATGRGRPNNEWTTRWRRARRAVPANMALRNLGTTSPAYRSQRATIRASRTERKTGASCVLWPSSEAVQRAFRSTIPHTTSPSTIPCPCSTPTRCALWTEEPSCMAGRAATTWTLTGRSSKTSSARAGRRSDPRSSRLLRPFPKSTTGHGSQHQPPGNTKQGLLFGSRWLPLRPRPSWDPQRGAPSRETTPGCRQDSAWRSRPWMPSPSSPAWATPASAPSTQPADLRGSLQDLESLWRSILCPLGPSATSSWMSTAALDTRVTRLAGLAVLAAMTLTLESSGGRSRALQDRDTGSPLASSPSPPPRLRLSAPLPTTTWVLLSGLFSCPLGGVLFIFVHTHTHTHARTHARKHARTHARKHARTHAHTNTHTHTHTLSLSLLNSNCTALLLTFCPVGFSPLSPFPSLSPPLFTPHPPPPPPSFSLSLPPSLPLFLLSLSLSPSTGLRHPSSNLRQVVLLRSERFAVCR